MGRQRANTLEEFKGDELESNYTNRTQLMQSEKQIVNYSWIKLTSNNQFKHKRVVRSVFTICYLLIAIEEQT